METKEALTLKAQPQLYSMSIHRGFCGHIVGPVHWVVVLLCAISWVTSSGPCAMNVGSKYDACGPYKENFNEDYNGEYAGDVGPGFVSGNSVSRVSAESVCGDSNLFCFPSTLTGLMSGQNIDESTGEKDSQVEFDSRLASSSSQDNSNLSWASNYGNFKLLNGGVVSCFLSVHEGSHDMPYCQTNSCDQDCISSCKGTLFNRKPPGNVKAVKPGSSDGSLPLHVELSPPVLDWGQQHLYFPSLAFLMVTNTHSKHNLQVYEPHSTSTQFYPCNFSEMTLGPGEVASVCFVFWPTRLGLNSGHLILQTGFGGFLIQIRGFAVESPYGIQPLLDLDKSSSGSLRKNVALYNPFDETLYVEEITAWISFSSGSTSHLTKLICSMNNSDGYAEPSIPSVQKWLDITSDEVDVPDMAVRPHRKWEIAPHSSETIVELAFHHSQEKILGAFCMQLLRSSADKTDVIMVPLESEMGMESTYYVLGNSVSVTGELLMPCEDSRTVLIALSLRNDASYLLRVVKISVIGETTNNFQFKFVEGLIVFPGTTSQVAVVTYTPVVSQLPEHPPEVPSMSVNCKLLIVTNDSSNPKIELLCNDIISICSQMLDSSVGYEHQPATVDYGIARTGFIDSGLHSQIKASKIAEADELVLQNWRSQGTAWGMSVLDSLEVVFPIVEIGSHHPRWIDVKNPSNQPVVMQLILNSGEIVDECKDQYELLDPSPSSSLGHNKNMTPSRHGFSLVDNAVTEAYVHPHGSATLGPIIFHPSSRCLWKSSALIRNNLSGVEWLSLRGFGGSLSLVMFEGSDQLQAIDFKFKLPAFLNFSPPDKLSSIEGNSNACSKPFLKELYAKNTGDLPVEVNRIEISGKGCQLDGFLVHTCKGFALEPGESTKIIISHQTDFAAVVLQRDLQLALASGILVIPMKAILPMSMLSFCKRSILWMRVKKFWVPIFLVTSVMFLLFCRILPQVVSFRSQDFPLRSRKYSIATVTHPEKASRLHRNQKDSSKFAIAAKINGFSRSIVDETMSGSGRRSSDCQHIASELGKVAEPRKITLGHQCQKECLLDTQSETILPSLVSKSVEFETSVLQEAALPGNLMVKVGKEKGKRRRKKKGSGAGLPAQFEVSSSQSGNSTPTSPLSPITSITPKRSWPLPLDNDQRPESRNPFSHIADRQPEKISGNEIGSTAKMLEPIIHVKLGSNSLSCPGEEKAPTPRRKASPVLLSSATFPSIGKSAPDLKLATPLLASTSPIAPHARAPGSKLERTRVETSDKKGNEDDFKYDIWGDHPFGLHLTGGRSGEVYAKSRFAAKYESDSFFLSGPQQVPSVGSRQEG